MRERLKPNLTAESRFMNSWLLNTRAFDRSPQCTPDLVLDL